MKFLAPLDMVKNEIRNFVLHLLASDPSSPVEGQQYHNATNHHPHYYNGSAFKDLTDAEKLNGQSSSYYQSRANHTGTQTASTISDFDNQVRTSRLDQMAAPTSAVSLNSQRLTNLSDPSSAQDAATKAYVDATAQGLDVKQSVRAASTANVNIASAPSAIDGVNLNNGDRVLLKDQTTGSQSGIYVFNGAASAMTRAADADSSAEVNAGLFVFVEEGTVNADSGWVLSTDNPVTLGTTALTFTQFSGAGQITAGAGLTKTGNQLDVGTASSGRIAVNADNIDLASGIVTPGTYESVTVDTYGRATAGTNPYRVKKYSATIGDGAATLITVTQGTHGCASDRTNSVFVIDEASGDQIFPNVTVASNGNVTIVFAVAPSADQYRVTILG